MTDPLQVKKIREKINQDEIRLQKLIDDTNRIWEDTGLDSRRLFNICSFQGSN